MSLISINFSPNLLNISLTYLKNSRLLLFKNKKSIIFYKRLEDGSFIKKNQISSLTLEASWKYLNNFSNFYRNLVFRARGFLILQGLGLKVQIIENFLEFKLGFSHKCYLEVEQEIYVKIKKNLLFLQSVNKERLGNFLYKIKMLRKPDIYKGKGIWYKNEKISLKPVKKTK